MNKKVKKKIDKLSNVTLKAVKKLSKISLDNSVEVTTDCFVEEDVMFTSIEFLIPVCEVEVDRNNR